MSYPQPKSKTYPQLPVHNGDMLPLVFFFLCITLTRLYIMDVVGSRIGKTLGIGDFSMGGEGSASVVNIDVPPSPPKKLK